MPIREEKREYISTFGDLTVIHLSDVTLYQEYKGDECDLDEVKVWIRGIPTAICLDVSYKQFKKHMGDTDV